MWKELRQPLSPKEMAAVVVLVVLTGASLYGLYRGGASLWHQRMLERAIPVALDGVRAERETLIGLIETYKAHFGYYPPLLMGAGTDRGVINPLCYELVGAQFDPRAKAFHVSITKDPMTLDEVKKYFNMSSFSNSVTFPATATNFLAGKPLAISPMTKDGELLGVSLRYTDFTSEQFWYDFDFSCWRYLTNPAQHNPGKFDIWIDIEVAGKHFTIGNWPEVK
jgi:hypothetical protein